MPRRRTGVLLSIEDQILTIGIERDSAGSPEFHGFALADELTKADPRRLLGHGTLYKALARLEREGLLVSRWEQIDASLEGRPRRRLYRVTASASGALAQSRQLQTSSASQLALS